MQDMLRQHRATQVWRHFLWRSAVRELAAPAQQLPSQVRGRQHPLVLSSQVAADPASSLFHRQIDVVLREGNKREKISIRRQEEWIPSCLQGRGKVPDLLLNVPIAPILQDLHSGLYAVQKLGKLKWSGPLYQLRFLPNPNGAPNPLPTECIRVKPHNMQLHHTTEVPRTIAFLYCPEEEPVRVRVPIQYINEEKCPGLKEGGWLNRVIAYVDINVAPLTKAPLFATMDVGGMRIKDRRRIGDLQFEGKGNGCRTVLDDDVMTTVISQV